VFEFKPPEARNINLTVNRVIVCWGNQAALSSLVDFLANEHQCGVHKLSKFPAYDMFESMQKNLRSKPVGNAVILVTDEEELLPFHAKYAADLLLLGTASGSIEVHKDRHSSLPNLFRCTGTSSPTGRTFDPSSPAMHNMRPSDGRLIDATKDQIGPRVPRHFDVKDTSWRGYSMGATVKEPECPMCEAGLPLKKSNVRFEDAPKPVTIMTYTFDGEMKLNDAQGREFIRVNAEGEAFVRGEKVATGQQDVYEMFRAWMQKTAGGLPQDRHTKMHDIPLPKAWEVDAQGNAFTPECLADLRKQLETHGFGSPIITKTGHDITNSVENQRLQGVIRDLYAEMVRASRAWEKGLHVGDIMQRLVDIAEGRIEPLK